MNNTVRIAVAAVAVVVVAFLGYQLLSGPNVGGDASPTPFPTPTATTEIPRAVGALDPGTYYLDDPTWTPVRFTFTVPAGWTARSDAYVYKHQDLPGELGFSPFVVTHVYTDACNSAGTLTEVGPSVDDLVQALVDQAGSESSTPADITFGGYPGIRIDLVAEPGLDFGTCRIPGLQVWANAAETSFLAIAGQVPTSVYIVDVNGYRVVIFAGHNPESPAADIAELEGIIASIEFPR